MICIFIHTYKYIFLYITYVQQLSLYKRVRSELCSKHQGATFKNLAQKPTRFAAGVQKQMTLFAGVMENQIRRAWNRFFPRQKISESFKISKHNIDLEGRTIGTMALFNASDTWCHVYYYHSPRNGVFTKNQRKLFILFSWPLGHLEFLVSFWSRPKCRVFWPTIAPRLNICISEGCLYGP